MPGLLTRELDYPPPTVVVPSLDGLAPFQIAFAAGPWRRWLFGPQGQGREYRGRPAE